MENAGLLDRIATGRDLVPGAIKLIIGSYMQSAAWHDPIENTCLDKGHSRPLQLYRYLSSHLANPTDSNEFPLTIVP